MATWDATREQNLKAGSNKKGDVLYWMAATSLSTTGRQLGFTQSRILAKENGSKARVVFALGAITTERRLDFQLKGLVRDGPRFERQGLRSI